MLYLQLASRDIDVGKLLLPAAEVEVVRKTEIGEDVTVH